ncbi:type 4a pilus biogenesis protein PilO [Vibrio sp. Isolate23]|uniref:type 4a pilus biogenesis protein PilO n=1 Tax=Vibrio sp. Isolate23 TaxID=2908533 RepID=UPI001EFD5745|nr:type 4a pilus biogenesis protein PilO [Vibrio sp. Isolate23]MCG9684589.1 type 4a pilus biogenesis protein PilO [Vibrio sp. Isolate23]
MIEVRGVSLASLSKLQRLWLCGTSLLVLLALGYWLVISPSLTHLESLLVKERQQKSIIEQKRQTVALLSQRRSELEQLEQRKAQQRVHFIQTIDVTGALSMINQIAQQHALVLSHMNQTGHRPKGPFLQSSLQFELSGQYQHIAAFFQTLVTRPNAVYFDALRWRRTQSDSPQLNLQGEVYLLLPLNEVSSES